MTAQEQLNKLAADVERKHDQWQIARERLRSAMDISASFAQPIFDHRDQVAFKLTPNDPKEARKVTLQLLDKMTEEGLVFAAGNAPGSLTIVDPGLAEREREAAGALSKANAEKVRYEDSHAEEIQAAAKKAEAESIRTTLQGDDPDAIRAVLNPSEPSRALVSSDLP